MPDDTEGGPAFGGLYYNYRNDTFNRKGSGGDSPIMFTGAAFFAPEVAKSVLSQVMALPYHIYVLATASTDLEATRPIQYGAILVLIGLVLGTSAIGVVARSRLAARSGRQ